MDVPPANSGNPAGSQAKVLREVGRYRWEPGMPYDPDGFVDPDGFLRRSSRCERWPRSRAWEVVIVSVDAPRTRRHRR